MLIVQWHIRSRRYRLTRRHTKSELSKLRDLDPARDQDEIIFDNLQSQDDVEDGAEGGSKVLKGPVEFVLDDCELGFGVVLLLKSMSQDELCEASLAPEYAAGEASVVSKSCTTALRSRCSRPRILSSSTLVIDPPSHPTKA